jgi:hypothetical protein
VCVFVCVTVLLLILPSRTCVVMFVPEAENIDTCKTNHVRQRILFRILCTVSYVLLRVICKVCYSTSSSKLAYTWCSILAHTARNRYL